MKGSIDLSLYLVTDRREAPLESLLSIVQQAVEGGVTIVQLREKSCSDREMIAIGKRVLSLLKPYRVPLIINDRVDVAHAIGADGVHLGQVDLFIDEARSILGKKALIGLSVESLEQALAVEKQAVDYLAASPLFENKTKNDCAAPWGLEKLKELCDLASHPIVAIGGITESCIHEVMQCGVRGVAVVSAIFHSPSPREAAFQLRQRMRCYAVSRMG